MPTGVISDFELHLPTQDIAARSLIHHRYLSFFRCLYSQGSAGIARCPFPRELLMRCPVLLGQHEFRAAVVQTAI